MHRWKKKLSGCKFTKLKTQQTGFYLSIRAQRAQVALQVSVGHQLHHNQGGLAFRHHTQQTHLGHQEEGFSTPARPGLYNDNWSGNSQGTLLLLLGVCA